MGNEGVLAVKVVQFGDGIFLRAFADWIIDLLNERTAFSGSVVVVSPLRRERPVSEERGDTVQAVAGDGRVPDYAVTAGEGLSYRVVLRGLSEGKRVEEERVVTCIKSRIDPYRAFDTFLAVADIPTLRLVISNTTEAGIRFNDRDIRPDVPADSFPAKVTQLLYRRFQTFAGDRSKGLVFLPCELIENNGDELRKTVLQYAAHWNLPAGFADWTTEACQFCNTLVDRIVTGYPVGYTAAAHRVGNTTMGHPAENTATPHPMGYTPARHAAGNGGIGHPAGHTPNASGGTPSEDAQLIDETRTVAAEPYYLWVIQAGESLNGIFPVHDASLNVKFVNDLTPYRTCKVRILNGAHTAMTLVGYLRGLRTVREAVEDPWMAQFLQELLTEEIIPTVPLSVEEVNDYARQVFERFRNPEIRHELKSIALNAVSKFSTRLLPTLLDRYRASGTLPSRLVDVFAALIVFYRGTWHDQPLPVNDSPETLNALSQCWSGEDPPQLNALLRNEALWGRDLTAIPELEDALRSAAVRLT